MLFVTAYVYLANLHEKIQEDSNLGLSHFLCISKVAMGDFSPIKLCQRDDADQFGSEMMCGTCCFRNEKSHTVRKGSIAKMKKLCLIYNDNVYNI